MNRSRRIRPLTTADLSGLSDLSSIPGFAESCGRCVLGESDPRSKLDWAAAVNERWGFWGVRAVDDGATIGVLTVAPAGSQARPATFSARNGSDTAILLSVGVQEEHRGYGIGRQLVQASAALLMRRDVRALDAVGSYLDDGSCLPPASWLQAVGFELVRPHPVTPGLRMNLQSTLRWKPDFGAAWSRLTSLVAQPGPAQPNGAAWREVVPTR